MGLIAALLWLPKAGEIERRTDALIAAYNRRAQARDRRPEVELVPRWAAKRFQLQSYHHFTTDLFFTHAPWRGRIRASKWIGAGLSPAKAAAFDRELQALLELIAPPRFPIRHRIRLQVFEPREGD